MQISEESLKEFQRIWNEDYGEELAADKARALASNVLEVFTLLRQSRAVMQRDRPHPSP